MTFAIPSPLAPGDTVAVVSPSSPPDRTELWAGLAWLRARYRIRMTAAALGRDGYLAGSDDQRMIDLRAAIEDHDVKAIVAARGGYGALRVTARIRWEKLVREPKWIVGFSDVTTLHAMAWRLGVASIHGPHVGGLGLGTAPSVRASWIASLESPRRQHAWTGLRVVRGGDATGIAVGGNLTLVHALAAAGQLSIPDGSVLFLEDVGEAPYRLDRMVTSLCLGGYMDRAAAIVLGGFERCAARADGRSADDVLDEALFPLGIPVVAGGPFGHQPENRAFVLGTPVRVVDDEVRFAVDLGAKQP